MDLAGIDIVKIAEGYGINGANVEDPKEVEAALKKALASRSPYVLAVKVTGTPEKCMGMDQSVNPPRYR